MPGPGRKGGRVWSCRCFLCWLWTWPGDARSILLRVRLCLAPSPAVYTHPCKMQLVEQNQSRVLQGWLRGQGAPCLPLALPSFKPTKHLGLGMGWSVQLERDLRPCPAPNPPPEQCQNMELKIRLRDINSGCV